MKDRIPSLPGRVKMTLPDGTVQYVTLEMADEPTQIGTPLNRITFSPVLAAVGVTAGTATALTLEGDGGFTLIDGATIRFRLHVASGSDPKINVNGTGAKALKMADGTPLKAGTPAGSWVVATYSQPLDFFVLRGSETPTERYGNGIGQISTYELAFRGGWSSSYNRI